MSIVYGGACVACMILLKIKNMCSVRVVCDIWNLTIIVDACDWIVLSAIGPMGLG